MYKYETIIYWSEEDECFIAEVPDLSELMVHGGSQEEALKNAQTAIRPKERALTSRNRKGDV